MKRGVMMALADVGVIAAVLIILAPVEIAEFVVYS